MLRLREMVCSANHLTPLSMTDLIWAYAQYHGGVLPMLPFKLIYSNGYYLPIGQHVFPAEKYRRIHDRLLETGVAQAIDFLDPQPATDEDILLVHTLEYVNKLKSSTLSPREEMELEVP